MRIRSRGFELEVETRGRGRPVVLLHGFMGSRLTWSEIMSALESRYLCIAIDLLGHGQSDAAVEAEEYGIDRMAQDVVSVMDSLGVERSHVLGYSMGGRIAMRLATTFSQRVLSMILESAQPGIETQEAREARVRDDEELAASIRRNGMMWFVDYWERLPLFASQQALPEAVRERIRSERLATNPAVAAACLEGMSPGRYEPMGKALKALQMPTLLIAGEEDTTYARTLTLLSRGMPGSELAITPNAGHAVHIERPDEFSRVILDFLRRQDQTERMELDVSSTVGSKA